MDYNSKKYLKISELIANDSDLVNHVPTLNSLVSGNTSSYMFQTSAVTIIDDAITAGNINLNYLTLRHNVTDLPTGSPTKCYIWYGVCSTAANTATKVVTIKTDVGTTPDEYYYNIQQKGSILFVTFVYTNSASVSSLKLSINGKTAVALKKIQNGSIGNLAKAGELQAGCTYMFVYNGTAWVCMTLDYNDTYTVPTFNASGGASTQYYLMGVPSTGGTTLYRYGSSGPFMKGVDLYTGSDINYKTDITPISGAFVDELFSRDDITYDFKWKDTNKDSSGFIAQWIEDIMPEVVDGDDNQKHVNYNAALSKVVGAMFKKIQEQQKEIDELKTIIKQKGEA